MTAVVTPISALNENTDKSSTVVGKITRSWTQNPLKKGNKAEQIFMLRDSSGSIKCHMYGSLAARAATIIKANASATIRIENIRVVREKGAGFRLYSLWNSCNLKTKISEVKNQSVGSGALITRFSPIKDIKDLQEGRHCDVLGMILSYEPIKECKVDSKPAKIREAVIYDSSGAQVTLTFWDDLALTSDYPERTILAIRNLKIKKFLGQTTLSVWSKSTLQVDPDTPEARKLTEWDQNKPANFVFLDISDFSKAPGNSHSIKVILGQKLTPLDLNLQLTVRVIELATDPEDLSGHFYECCPKYGCHKGVEESNGLYECTSCNMNYSHCIQSMKLYVLLANETGGFLATIFHKDLERIFPMSITSLYTMSKTDKTLYNQMLAQYFLKKDFDAWVRVTKKEPKSDLKWHIQRVRPVSTSQAVPAVPADLGILEPQCETEDALSPYLGAIEEVDAVPKEWRDSNKNKN